MDNIENYNSFLFNPEIFSVPLTIAVALYQTHHQKPIIR